MNLTGVFKRAAALVLCLLAGAAFGQSCPGDAPALSELAKAINAWEARSASRLSIPLRESLAADVCEEAADLVKRKIAAPMAIDAALARTIGAYLDLQLQTAQPARTVASLLRAEFNNGSGGLAKPQMRKLVRVKLSYVKHPDLVAVGAHEYPKPAELILSASSEPVVFKGRNKGSGVAVCEKSLALVAGTTAEFVCQ